MREETARTVANVVVAAAALGAAVVILRVPTLRRLAFGLLKTAVVTGIPAWLTHETKQAWEESSKVDRLRQGYSESAGARRAQGEGQRPKEG